MPHRHTEDASSHSKTANAFGVELATWGCVLDESVGGVLVVVVSCSREGHADGSCGGELGD